MVNVILEHPSGARRNYNFRTKKKQLREIQTEFLGTRKHFNTEAIVIGFTKKTNKRRKRSIFDW